MKQELEILEAKFNHFLNQTIIGASKDYYKKQMKYETRELRLIDDENYGEYLKEYVQQEEFVPFDSLFENEKLNIAIKALSVIETTVLFLHYKQGYKINEIAKIVKKHPDTISRIKKRALNKLKLFMEGDGANE